MDMHNCHELPVGHSPYCTNSDFTETYRSQSCDWLSCITGAAVWLGWRWGVFGCPVGGWGWGTAVKRGWSTALKCYFGVVSATLVLSAHPHALSCFIPPIVDGPGYSLTDLTDAAAPVPIGSIQVHHCNVVHSDAGFVLTWFWQILNWLDKMLQIIWRV